METNMFSGFCNICYKNEGPIMNICGEDEHLKDVLINFIGHKDVISNSLIYTCSSCNETLRGIHTFRNMCLSNLIRVRELYNEIGKLELEGNSTAASLLRDVLNSRVVQSQKIEKSEIKKEEVDDSVNENRNSGLNQSRNDIPEIEVRNTNSRSNSTGSIQNEERPISIPENDESNVVISEKQLNSSCSSSLVINLEDDNYDSICISDDEPVNLENDSTTTEALKILSRSQSTEQVHKRIRQQRSETSKLKNTGSTEDRELPRKMPRTSESGRRVYMCGYQNCGKTCNKLSEMKVHQFSHSNDRPYNCSWDGCDWKFSRLAELTKHFRRHTSPKSFKCTQCDREFTRSDNLTLHMRKHDLITL